jgi:Co/Zn/Cd efflux system component
MESNEDTILSEARSRLVAEFGIEHSTIQVEEEPCPVAFHE